MEKCPVTIFVTVYNIEKYLERFFDCLDKQTFKDYQLLIIDDGSTDNSLSICQAYAEKDSRIKLVSIEHVGISAARNKILGMLDTEFATTLDGDDYFEPDYLKHLMDAQIKYNADFVISNVISVNPEGVETSRFTPRKEAFYTKEQIPEILPELINENRMNYLYTKLFRTKYLKGIRVEPDVKQGSDTMINMQYVIHINNLAVIEDYDYHYVNYTTRSVTSYCGTDFFWRVYRIHNFIYDVSEKNGFMSDQMLFAIDKRIMNSGRYALFHITRLDIKVKDKLAYAHKVIHSDEYLRSYNRLKKNGQLETLGFKVFHPGEEDEYILRMHKRKRKNQILKYTPKFVFNTYHNIKKILGLLKQVVYEVYRSHILPQSC